MATELKISAALAMSVTVTGSPTCSINGETTPATAVSRPVMPPIFLTHPMLVFVIASDPDLITCGEGGVSAFHAWAPVLAVVVSRSLSVPSNWRDWSSSSSRTGTSSLVRSIAGTGHLRPSSPSSEPMPSCPPQILPCRSVRESASYGECSSRITGC